MSVHMKNLSLLCGISGDEDNVRNYITEEISGKCEYSIDNLGNVIAFPILSISIIVTKSILREGYIMGTILENLHKFHIETAVDDLHKNGGNPHVNDNHKLESIYRCRMCGYVYDETKTGKPFTTIDHCPVCGAVLVSFEQLR